MITNETTEKEGGEGGEDTTGMLWDAVVDLQNRVKKLERKTRNITAIESEAESEGEGGEIKL